MTRWLATQHSQSAPSAALIALGGFLMGICATVFIVGLCTVSSRRKRIRDKMSSDGDNSPTKQSGKAFKNPQAVKELLLQPTEDQGQQHRSPVWQRAILMGERCKPPTFSGLILYDEQGNRLKERPMKPPGRF